MEAQPMDLGTYRLWYPGQILEPVPTDAEGPLYLANTQEAPVVY